jgi:hypothetical protein
VREILFSFYNGELYKISATYERSAIEGLTAEDLAQSISEKYGPQPVTEIDLSTGERQGGTAEKVANCQGHQSRRKRMTCAGAPEESAEFSPVVMELEPQRVPCFEC